MKLVIQRVKESNLKIDGNNFSSIGNGMVILIGISKEDDTSKLKKIVTNDIIVNIMKILGSSLVSYNLLCILVLSF